MPSQDQKNVPLGGAGFTYRSISAPTANPVVRMPKHKRLPNWQSNYRAYRDTSIVDHAGHDPRNCEICQ